MRVRPSHRLYMVAAGKDRAGKEEQGLSRDRARHVGAGAAHGAGSRERAKAAVERVELWPLATALREAEVR
jgi:hypothetical protein